MKQSFMLEFFGLFFLSLTGSPNNSEVVEVGFFRQDALHVTCVHCMLYVRFLNKTVLYLSSDYVDK